MMKRTLPVLVFVALGLGALTACGSDAPAPPATTSGGSTTTTLAPVTSSGGGGGYGY